MNAKTSARGVDVAGDPLGGVLARVHADDDELLTEPLLELPDTREHVHAVDSTVCPEVEQYEASAKVRQPKWRGDVEPIQPSVNSVRGRGRTRGHQRAPFS